MVNILVPSMGNSLFFKESYFPKPMIEIAGETILERLVRNFEDLKEKHFIFVFSQEDCRKFHMDSSAKLLTEGNTTILTLENETAGALCTSLMAIDYIDNEVPLIISNFDQVIDVDYINVLKHFNDSKADGGIIVFDSVHPRWSYARIRDENVVEVAEKRPLSKHAIAGFYYFREGNDFVQSATKVLLKENHHEGRYYISSTLNEMILMGRMIDFYKINRQQYHSFYSPEKIKEYENQIRGEK